MGRYICVFCLLALVACETTPVAITDVPIADDRTTPAKQLASTALAAPDPELSLLSTAVQRGGSASATKVLRSVQTALKDDPSLIASKLAVSAGQRDALRTAEFFRPTVTTSATAFAGSDIGVTLDITQPLYDFGKRRAAVTGLLIQSDRDRLAVAQLRQGLAQDMLLAALNAQQAQAQIDLNRRRIAAFSEAVSRADNLVALEIIGASDASLAKARLNQATKDRRTSEIALRQASALWQRLAGSAIPPAPRLASDVLRRFGITNLTTAQGQVLQHNVDVRVAKADLVVLQSQAQQTDLARLPTVNAVSQTRLSPSGTGRRTQVGLSLDYTLFSRGQRDEFARVKEQLDVQQARITGAERDLGFNAETLWRNIQDSRELADLEQSGIATLRDRADDLESQLATGLIAFSDVVEARTEQFETELAALTNRFAADRAALQLLILSGVLSVTD